MKKKVAINGLGRIGKAILRAKFELNYDAIEITAINAPGRTPEDVAHMIKYDSVHGRFKADVKVTRNSVIIQGSEIKLINERDIAAIKWHQLGVDIIFECTGKFNSRAEAASHINAGAKKVLVSAPCEEADITIIYKVNDELLKAEHEVISIGSCTTNCLAPIVKILNDEFGIESGFMTTIHAYTNDQRILDGSHKDPRRSRAAAISMIPTTTGAARTIGVVLPELTGKLDGAAIRVPTSNVSMVDLACILSKSVDAKEINKVFQSYASGHMLGVLAYEEEKLVSCDFNHTSYSAIIDANETKALRGNLRRVVAWYDNEWAYAVRMLDVCGLL